MLYPPPLPAGMGMQCKAALSAPVAVKAPTCLAHGSPTNTAWVQAGGAHDSNQQFQALFECNCHLPGTVDLKRALLQQYA